MSFFKVRYRKKQRVIQVFPASPGKTGHIKQTSTHIHEVLVEAPHPCSAMDQANHIHELWKY